MAQEIKEVTALTVVYDLIVWIIPVLDRFPKSQKFLLADRIENLLLDIMNLIIQAIYSKNKTILLRDANLKIEQFRMLIRVAKDLGYLNIKRYEFIALSVNKAGKEIGVWLKYSQGKDGAMEF